MSNDKLPFANLLLETIGKPKLFEKVFEFP